ncbi:MAG: capsule biosynthesis protein CapK [Ruminococcaceae bacterium]|nr:capsule biosynthesis protein CapK [Oscillospiraceae bacterium]
MSQSYPIDFVIPWVDDRDPVWREKKAKYTGIEVKEGNTEVRYRDWDTLKYWFRGVEKFAPWVRYVYFVTDDQKPEWLNLDHPKLKWVKHSDFIPQEYLPAFSANVIEWNIHRIEGLSEHFVYFNDDVFLIKSTTPEDFFVDGLPCDLPNIGPLYASGIFSYMLFNNVYLLNKHFSLKKSISENPKKWIKHQSLGGLFKLALYGRKDLIPNSNSWHIQTSYNKKNFSKLWEEEYEVIHQTCQNRLRTKNDVTSYCVRDWQLLSGEFYPKKPIGKLFHTASMSYSDEVINYLKHQKGKTVCLNDTEQEKDFELHKKQLIDEFEKIVPEKSSFEL